MNLNGSIFLRCLLHTNGNHHTDACNAAVVGYALCDTPASCVLKHSRTLGRDTALQAPGAKPALKRNRTLGRDTTPDASDQTCAAAQSDPRSQHCTLSTICVIRVTHIYICVCFKSDPCSNEFGSMYSPFYLKTVLHLYCRDVKLFVSVEEEPILCWRTLCWRSWKTTACHSRSTVYLLWSGPI